MVTVKEIAKICGVSASTVSNVLNEKSNVSKEVRQRVLDAVKETGYHPNYFAASIRKRKSDMVMIIVEELGLFTIPPIVKEIMRQCEIHGFRTILVNLRLYDRWQDTWYHDEEKIESVLGPALQEVESIRADGVIYVAGHGRLLRCFPKTYTIPTVIAYAEVEGNRFPSIILDDEAGGYQMGKYLASMGHSRIGVIAGTADNAHTVRRLSGYQRALFEAGILYNPDWILYGTWEREAGYEYAKKLNQMGVTAIWCMNDQMAGGAYDYFYEHGIEVGRDISIAGYDGMEAADFLHPRLVTEVLPLTEIGRWSVERLAKLIRENEEEETFQPVRIPCKWKEGGSVRNIREKTAAYEVKTNESKSNSKS